MKNSRFPIVPVDVKVFPLCAGLPAAIVILAVFLKPDAYGRVALDATDPESTQM